MDYTCRTRTLQYLSKAIEKGNIVLSHKLQRPEGQWNIKQKTDLIDSLLRKYPINPTYGIKEDNIISVIDGIQRLSCIRDFLSNGFALSKSMESVIVNGVEKSLAGMKFKKLDDDTKDAILNAELQVYELTECTEKDVREIFRRQNAGKPLNTKQLRVVNETDSFSESIYILATHPFMGMLTTKTQKKNGTDRDLIIQTLMLIISNNKGETPSFRSKDINLFISECSDEVDSNIISTLLIAMDKLYDVYKVEPLQNVRMPLTSIPMILFSAYQVTKEDKSFDKFMGVVDKFLVGYESNKTYKKFVQSATSDVENVKGRLQYWIKLIKDI